MSKRFWIENGEILDCGFFLSGEQQYVDVMNNLDQQITELEAENERLKKYETIYYLNQLQASNEDINKFKQNELQQSINISDLLKDNTKQVCEKIIDIIDKEFNCLGYIDEISFDEFKRILLDKIEKGE